MSICCHLQIPRVSSASFLVSLIFLIYFPGIVLPAVVTLDSMKIYRTHEWFNVEPAIYFSCKGENQTALPDVKQVNVSYTFKGEESWQPLTEFTSVKCKRCGFYEKDDFKSDDVLDEWEFCPSDFAGSDGKNERIIHGEFDATFLCPQCVPLAAVWSLSVCIYRAKGCHFASKVNELLVRNKVGVGGLDNQGTLIPVWLYNKSHECRQLFVQKYTHESVVHLSIDSTSASKPHKKGNETHLAVVIVISALVSTVFVLGVVAAYKYWQKKKREQDQARFLKLFEDADDIEDELGLGSVL
ncbi:hypothetical protein POTOM_051686 [Populus tomentosa]|uniref:DUF7953 domain-containing protein n=1 Tax=Populus tomentosa TaxID=118781 RepID=A0A8X8C9Y5_POPTO|nr:hypothetical protein POTOM_051686 [Populus tomentosa]